MVTEQVQDLDINRLITSPLNPRLDLGEMDELIESIKQKGIEEPLIVRKRKDKWEVIIGERRFKGAQKARLRVVPCIIRKYTDNEAVEVSIIENVMRKELTPVERGTAIKFLLDKYPEKYSSQGVLAHALGVSSATLSIWLSIISFDKAIQGLIGTEKEARDGKKISLNMALAVKSRIQKPERQKEILQKAIRNKWSTPNVMRQLEKELGPRQDSARPIFVSLTLLDLVKVIRAKEIEWDIKTYRLPGIGETINFTTPRIGLKVLKIRSENGKKVIEIGEVK